MKFAPYPERDNATFAARAALAAEAQGAYWAMHEKMLANFAKLTQKNLVKLAAEVGLDTKKFEVDLNAEWTAVKVARDLKLTRSLDIWQTPTYLINGRTMVGERPIEHFKRIIDQELNAERQGLEGEK